MQLFVVIFKHATLWCTLRKRLLMKKRQCNVAVHRRWYAAEIWTKISNHKQSHRSNLLSVTVRRWCHIRYDTIRDAILTCARKPTWVGLIYRTETTTKNCKTEKLKGKNSLTVKVWGNHVVSPEEEKERLQWEGFAEKEGFKSGMPVLSTPRLDCSVRALKPLLRFTDLQDGSKK